MAGPIDTSLTGEIWHLSIDDLLAPLPETTRLGGSGPFVINLSASSAPIAVPAKGIAACQRAHVYQVQRFEDRRLRYRLRLGPFANEDEAVAILDEVRDIYPSALTATADADDLRAIATMQAKAAALHSAAGKSAEKPAEKRAEKPAERPAEKPAVKPAVKLAAPPAAASSQPITAKPTRRAAPTALSPLGPPAEQTSRVRAPTAVPTPSSPLPVARPAAVPTLNSPVAVARPAAVPTLNSPVAVARPAAILPRLPQAVAAVPAPRPVEQIDQRLLSFETTQTIRALTQLEMEDEKVLHWFVIQLSVAEDAFDPDTVPNLDIYSVYRLYSVAGIEEGRIVHALRLGFFSEEIAAGAVASYLTAYYDKPTIKRVSVAERQRFAHQPLEPRKDVGATGKHSVIEITDERFIREKRIASPVAK